MVPEVPAIRVTTRNDAPVRSGGRYVLYWMTAARRPRWNFALDRAVRWAEELGLPLVVLEALAVDYPHASDRLHGFAIQGMGANQALAQRQGGVGCCEHGVLRRPAIKRLSAPSSV